MKQPERVAELLAELRALAENDFERHRLDVLEKDLHDPPKVENVGTESQRFEGVIYRKKNSGHYSQYNPIHRVVWSYFFGEIPEGYEIHHIDCNPANNNPENLQCLTQAAHAKLHAEIAGTVPPPPKTTVRQCVNCGKEFTVAERADNNDYCSPSCRIAHSFTNLREPRICQRCGKEFVVYKYSTARFCSKECRFADVQIVKKTCPVCGKEFDTHTWDEKNCCSHSCASSLMWQTSRAEDRTKFKPCEFCGEKFFAKNKNRRFCSKSCAMKYRYKKD